MDMGTARKGYLVLGRNGMFGLWAGTTLLVGADRQCRICIELDHVSRQHCELFVDESDRCFIRDLCSLNGTLVNGKRLIANSPTELACGDVVDLRGGMTFVVISFPLENFRKHFAF